MNEQRVYTLTLQRRLVLKPTEQNFYVRYKLLQNEKTS